MVEVFNNGSTPASKVMAVTRETSSLQPAGGGGFIFSEAANNRRLELQMRFTF